MVYEENMKLTLVDAHSGYAFTVQNDSTSVVDMTTSARAALSAQDGTMIIQSDSEAIIVHQSLLKQFIIRIEET